MNQKYLTVSSMILLFVIICFVLIVFFIQFYYIQKLFLRFLTPTKNRIFPVRIWSQKHSLKKIHLFLSRTVLFTQQTSSLWTFIFYYFFIFLINVWFTQSVTHKEKLCNIHNKFVLIYFQFFFGFSYSFTSIRMH